jgi:hypothetical protein
MKGNKIKIDKHVKYADREKAAKDLEKAGKEEWTVLVDAMNDRAHTAWGNLPNMGFLIDPRGLIAHKWAWIQSAGGKTKNGDEDTRTADELLGAVDDLTPWSIADDTQLPLWDTRTGEWLTYDDLTVHFSPGREGTVTCGWETVELKKADLPEKRAKPKEETLMVGKLKLPCVVVEKDGVQTWYCAWLPGDAVAKVVKEGKTILELTDAGFEKGKSWLVEYDPDAK